VIRAGDDAPTRLIQTRAENDAPTELNKNLTSGAFQNQYETSTSSCISNGEASSKEGFTQLPG